MPICNTLWTYRDPFRVKQNALPRLSVCPGCDAAAAARIGLPAHKHGAAPWPETRKRSGQQPWRGQNCRLWTGAHLHLQYRAHSRCKWGNAYRWEGEAVKQAHARFLDLRRTSPSPPSLPPLRWWRCGTELLRCCWTPSTCPRWTCGALAASSRSSSTWGKAPVCVIVIVCHVRAPFNKGRDCVPAWRLLCFSLWPLVSHRPMFQGYSEAQQLQKIFEWVSLSLSGSLCLPLCILLSDLLSCVSFSVIGFPSKEDWPTDSPISYSVNWGPKRSCTKLLHNLGPEENDLLSVSTSGFSVLITSHDATQW